MEAPPQSQPSEAPEATFHRRRRRRTIWLGATLVLWVALAGLAWRFPERFFSIGGRLGIIALVGATVGVLWLGTIVCVAWVAEGLMTLYDWAEKALKERRRRARR